MSSSTSSSEEQAWAAFARWLFGGAAVFGALMAGWIVVVDPFDTLPVSPSLDRVPIATNARFSFPSLARSDNYDSAIIGTSTSRLLRPRELNALLGARFANLAMNSATAYEQYRMLQVFGRHHPRARAVIMGIDLVWCGTGDSFEKYTPRPFPEWMYDDDPWNDLLHHFDFYTIEQAGRQFATMMGWRPIKYGRDGYTNFLPDPAEYDLAKVQASLAAVRVAAREAPQAPTELDPEALKYPTHFMLREVLGGLPAETLKIIFFAPYHRHQHPVADSVAGVEWKECKTRVARMSTTIPNLVVADFMIESPFTTTDTNYWDPLHYSVAAADTLMRDLASAAMKRVPGQNFDVLDGNSTPRDFASRDPSVTGETGE